MLVVKTSSAPSNNSAASAAATECWCIGSDGIGVLMPRPASRRSTAGTAVTSPTSDPGSMPIEFRIAFAARNDVKISVPSNISASKSALDLVGTV